MRLSGTAVIVIDDEERLREVPDFVFYMKESGVLGDDTAELAITFEWEIGYTPATVGSSSGDSPEEHDDDRNILKAVLRCGENKYRWTIDREYHRDQLGHIAAHFSDEIESEEIYIPTREDALDDPRI
tara:strand:+ start:145 stop:528 length:384 start_codon:yes stop_codon:yes gene_type:complete